MTDLYFIRHGQSEANLSESFAGATDSPLTPLGKKQAEATATFFEDVKADKVYASPLQRAYNTGLAVAKRYNIEIETDDRLKEIYGGKWEAVPFSELINLYPEDFKVWMTDLGKAVCTEGESTVELQNRVNQAVCEIVEKNPGKKIVIATHATPIRVMECIWNKVSLTQMKDIPWVSNASVTHVRYKNGEGKIILRSYDKHLGNMATVLPDSI